MKKIFKFFNPADKTFWDIVLLTCLLISIFIIPLLPAAWQQKSVRVMFTAMFFSAVFTLERKYHKILFLSMAAFIMEWVAGINDLIILQAISKSLNVVFFILIIFFLIHQVASSKEVTARVILGSVIGYFLLGLVFSIFVNFILKLDPRAFSINFPVEQTNYDTHFGESIYYSFVTYATVGYGDIVPVKPFARSLAVMIAAAGQLYVTVIIALIVGKFASKQPADK